MAVGLGPCWSRFKHDIKHYVTFSTDQPSSTGRNGYERTNRLAGNGSGGMADQERVQSDGICFGKNLKIIEGEI